MIINEDFKFRDDIKIEQDETVPIELLLDPYKGVVYRYTVVGFKENEDETGTLQYRYNLYEMGKHTETELRKDKRFETVLGLILNALILEATTDTTDGNRENHIEEPSAE